ncbi:MAG: DUF4968 domain-containing protein, partial [Bacteroidales bacterium]|nr:DUF4968 domain-containing protein [Bacteroidales bacterium]
MKRLGLILFLLAICTLISCEPLSYTKDNDGVIVMVKNPAENGPAMVRLRVLGDKIIHVSATPEKRFPDPSSLVVLHQNPNVEFLLHEETDRLTVETEALRAHVLVRTGEVIFEDIEGNVLLREQVGGGKSFEPIEVDGTRGYSFSQIFESPDDEAFYGLGQHQSDEFNYKGKNEELFQYNTKVSVPFVVSNKGYGVLMDSYSLMRFGNPEEYKQIGDVFTLYDKEGKPGSLTGTYSPMRGEPLVRSEKQLYFEHLVAPELAKVVNLPEDFQFYGSEVAYEGSIEAPSTGDYQFILYYAGYTSVTIGGETVVPERWRTAWNPNAYKFTVHLEKGE